MDKDIPLTFPSCTTYQYHFSNNSEKNRYSKMITDLLKLKYLISVDKENKEFQYLKQFLIKNGLNNTLFITSEYLLKFKNYLDNSNFNNINPNETMKQNLINCFSYHPYDHVFFITFKTDFKKVIIMLLIKQ